MIKQINYCKVEDCERKVHGYGHCLMHYKRLAKHGTTDKHTWTPRSGYTLDNDMKLRISQKLLGRKLSEEHRWHIKDGMVGKKAKGEKAYNWSGNKPKYSAVHAWIRRNFGTPKECDNCNITNNIVFDWANISGEYNRDYSDWVRLCRRCHFLIDGIGLQYRNKETN